MRDATARVRFAAEATTNISRVGYGVAFKSGAPKQCPTSDTTAPGASVSSTIRALSSSEKRRRLPVPVITSSRRTLLALGSSNHLIEEAIVAAVNDGDFSAFERLLSVVSAPYDDHPAFRRYADPPRPDQVVRETFCGT
jgi:hypothetical protein